MNILIKDIDIDILSKGVFCANLVTKNGKSYILIKVPDENGYAQNKYFPFNEISTPHGRLIDVNKLKSIIGLMTSHPCGCQLETVKDVLWLLDGKVEGEYVVPTIVEAEE